MRRGVLHDENGRWQIGWELRDERAQGLDSAHRSANDDDVACRHVSNLPIPRDAAEIEQQIGICELVVARAGARERDI